MLKLILYFNLPSNIDFNAKQLFLNKLNETRFKNNITELTGRTFLMDGSGGDEEKILSFYENLDDDTRALLIKISITNGLYTCRIIGIDYDGQAFLLEFDFEDRIALLIKLESDMREVESLRIKILADDYLQLKDQTIPAYIDKMALVS